MNEPEWIDPDSEVVGEHHHTFLAEIVGHHFDGWSAAGTVASIGMGDVKIDCRVNNLRSHDSYWTASLFYSISGSAFGPDPVFASMSGYGQDPRDAILTGGCNWACSFGPVIRMALGAEVDGDQQSVKDSTVSIEDRNYRVLTGSIGRSVFFEGHHQRPERVLEASLRLAPEGLTQKVIDSGLLPPLTSQGISVLSSFVSDSTTSRTVEVKLDGTDASGMDYAFIHGAPEPEGGISLLREFAVLVPQPLSSPRTLTRGSIERVLAELSQWTDPQEVAGWQGWQNHRGALEQTLTSKQIQQLTRCTTNDLPNSYIHFLTKVAGSGAGPGYGLRPPSRPKDGKIPLASAGCGCTWVLHVSGPSFGEVWSDASGSDETFTVVADSFVDWYADWLHHSRRSDGPWLQWDNTCCSTAAIASQVLGEVGKATQQLDENGYSQPSLADRFRPSSISISGAGNEYWFGDKSGKLDPCHGCVSLMWKLGCDPSVFAPSSNSLTGKTPAAPSIEKTKKRFGVFDRFRR
jgi:hypothetical protein